MNTSLSFSQLVDYPVFLHTVYTYMYMYGYRNWGDIHVCVIHVYVTNNHCSFVYFLVCDIYMWLDFYHE